MPKIIARLDQSLAIHVTSKHDITDTSDVDRLTKLIELAAGNWVREVRGTCRSLTDLQNQIKTGSCTLRTLTFYTVDGQADVAAKLVDRYGVKIDILDFSSIANLGPEIITVAIVCVLLDETPTSGFSSEFWCNAHSFMPRDTTVNAGASDEEDKSDSEYELTPEEGIVFLLEKAEHVIQAVQYKKFYFQDGRPDSDTHEAIAGPFVWKSERADRLLTLREKLAKIKLLGERFGRETDFLRNAGDPNLATLRVAIPQEVRTFVWQRDQGACVTCGSNQQLEFDHIIPVSKGGANTARNIQLLCQNCNRSKSDMI